MLTIYEQVLPAPVFPTNFLQKASLVNCNTGVKTRNYKIKVVCNVTITGGSGGSWITNGIDTLITLFRILENNQPTHTLNGTVLAYLTNRQQLLPIQRVIPGAITAATYNVEAYYQIAFAERNAADPSETSYVDLNAANLTQHEWTVTTLASSVTDGILITGTGSVLNSVSITAVQTYDPVTQVMPYFLPRIEQFSSNPISSSTSAGQGYNFYLNLASGIRAESILLQAYANGVPVTTALVGSITVRGDKYLYYTNIGTDQLLQEQYDISPAITPALSLIEIPFRKDGKLSEMFISGQDTNFRIVADITVSGGNPVTLVATVIERLPVAGFTRGPLPANW